MTRLARQARDRRHAVIHRRMATDRARHALALALYEALVDGLEFGPLDLATPADREWVHGAVAVPLQESVDVALEALAYRVTILLERAPNELGPRYVRSHEGSELGWE